MANPSTIAHTKTQGSSPLGNPWVQLFIGVICMACVANLQYGWTLFILKPMRKRHFANNSAALWTTQTVSETRAT